MKWSNIVVKPVGVLSQMIHDCLTGKDGVSFDPARIYWAIGFNCFLAMTVYITTRLEHPTMMDLLTWTGAFGAMMVTGGYSVAVKSKTEPLPEPPETKTAANKDV